MNKTATIPKVDTFSNRLNRALLLRSMSPAELSKKTGIGKPSISNWLNGKYEAKNDKLYILSKTLNVNEAWLMGLDAPIDRKESSHIELNHEDQERIRLAAKITNLEDTETIEAVKLLINLEEPELSIARGMLFSFKKHDNT